MVCEVRDGRLSPDIDPGLCRSEDLRTSGGSSQASLRTSTSGFGLLSLNVAIRSDRGCNKIMYVPQAYVDFENQVARDDIKFKSAHKFISWEQHKWDPCSHLGLEVEITLPL